jgi:hypothetical protein
MQASGPVPATNTLRPLKLMTVLNIILLSIQAWSGDVVNLFAVFPQGPVSNIGGAVQALDSVGWVSPLALFHGIDGVVILLLSIGVSAVAFRRTRMRSLRVVSLLGLLSVISALIGGYLFVFSGFLNNGNSAQMGGSFIGAYAMNFLVLYYIK